MLYMILSMPSKPKKLLEIDWKLLRIKKRKFSERLISKTQSSPMRMLRKHSLKLRRIMKQPSKEIN